MPDRYGPATAIALACYGRLLHLYPDAFYRANAGDLRADFQDASDESAARDGWIGLLLAWFATVGDLPLSLAREWLRTPWPVVWIIAGTVSTLVVAKVLGVNRLLRPFRMRVAAGVPVPSDSPQLLILLSLMVLVPIVGVVFIACVFKLVAWRPRVRHRV